MVGILNFFYTYIIFSTILFILENWIRGFSMCIISREGRRIGSVAAGGKEGGGRKRGREEGLQEKEGEEG